MSAYLEPRIEKPDFFGLRPTSRGRGSRKPFVIGFDTEADKDGPMLIQISDSEGESEEDVWEQVIPPDGREQCMGWLLHYVAQRCTRKDTEYIIFGFNLAYEFTQLFGHYDDDVVVMKDIIFEPFTVTNPQTGEVHEYRVEVFNDKRYFAHITNLSTKRMVRLVDAMAFYPSGGLNGVAKMLNLGEKYYGRFDITNVTRELLDDPEFRRYARQDAYITRRIGEHILGMHEDYDVPTTYSAPHFAATVFKHRFLNREIMLPEPELEQWGLWSYHGGKNGFYLPGPARVDDVYAFDITSAYPEAMRQLPDVEQCEWFKSNTYRPGVHAIVHATLRYERCQYRGMMSSEGTWPQTGYVEDAFITSYELDAMVEQGECRILSYEAWEMRGPSGGPLVRYVDTFFDLKARTEGPERETAKLFLNSLYGKFFQKQPLGDVGALDLETGEWVVTNPDMEFDWRAGGLYHPPIASLITGYVRAKIHRLEHKYGSLMTSTDGFFGVEPPDSTDLGKHLGGLTVDGGDLEIWRERCYVFTPDDHPEKVKAAFHGFFGRDDNPDASTTDNMVAALRRIPLAHGTYLYESRQMVTLKLSVNRFDGERHKPGSFITVPRTFTI